MSNGLKIDTYRRASGHRPWAPLRLGRPSPWAFAACIAIAIALLTMSRLEHPVIAAIRSGGLEVTTPLIRAAMTIFGPLNAAARRIGELNTLREERDRLIAENQKLKSWEARATDLERRAQQLELLTRVVAEPHLQFATVRIISNSSGPFVRLAMVDAGREHGVRTGYPIVSGDGLVGRIIATGLRASRLLLLTDFNSRIPVQIGAQFARAVVHGDNGPLPRLSFLQTGAVIVPGDSVFTSGVGGVFPRGLRVGTVVDVGDELRVELAATLNRLDYVSVLFFDTLGGLTPDETGPANTPPPIVSRRSSVGRPTASDELWDRK
ncbi:MAG: rod shape-determining protein MreC [Hyphomicrobiaceae bacterium]|nr:rod shape-determining protein MreC [Hyphomicrobiaceae bacterium]